jgi:hypothetical protein
VTTKNSSDQHSKYKAEERERERKGQESVTSQEKRARAEEKGEVAKIGMGNRSSFCSVAGCRDSDQIRKR